MPTASITFNLEFPDECRSHRIALSGMDSLLALCAIERRIRDELKHNEPSDETRRVLATIQLLIPSELTALLYEQAG